MIVKRSRKRARLFTNAANKVDGVITGSHNLAINEYENVSLPIVSFDRFLAPGIPIVSSQNFQGGQKPLKPYLQVVHKRLQLLLVLITQAHLAIIDWLVINKQWKNGAEKRFYKLIMGPQQH